MDALLDRCLDSKYQRTAFELPRCEFAVGLSLIQHRWLGRWSPRSLEPFEREYAHMMLGNASSGATAAVSLLVDAAKECAAAERAAAAALLGLESVPEGLSQLANSLLAIALKAQDHDPILSITDLVSSWIEVSDCSRSRDCRGLGSSQEGFAVRRMLLSNGGKTKLPITSQAEEVMDSAPEATLQDLRLLLACLVLEHGPGLTRDSLTQTYQLLGRPSSSASSCTSSVEPLGNPEAKVPLSEQANGGSERDGEPELPQPRSTMPLPLLQLEAATERRTAGHTGGLTTAISAGPAQNAADHRQAPEGPAESNVGTACFNAGPEAQGLTALQQWPSNWQPQTDTADAQRLEAAPVADQLEWLPYGLPPSTWRQALRPQSPAQLSFLAHAPVGFPVSLAEASAPPQQAVGYPAAFVGQPPAAPEHSQPAHIGLTATPAPRVVHSAALPPGHEDGRSSPVAAPAMQRIQAEQQSDTDGGASEPVVSAREEAGQQAELLEKRRARRHSSSAGDPALGELIARAEQLHRDMDRALQAHGQLRQERVAAAVKGRRDAGSSPTSRSCEHPSLHPNSS